MQAKVKRESKSTIYIKYQIIITPTTTELMSIYCSYYASIIYTILHDVIYMYIAQCVYTCIHLSTVLIYMTM